MTPAAARSLGTASERLGGEGGMRTEVSVIVPVTERPHDLAWIYRTFSPELHAAGRAFGSSSPWSRGPSPSLEPWPPS
jgi:hypothetical protein